MLRRRIAYRRPTKDKFGIAIFRYCIMAEFHDRVSNAVESVLEDEKNLPQFMEEVHKVVEDFYNSRRICKQWIEQTKLQQVVERFSTHPVFAPAALRILRRIEFVKSPDYVSYFDVRMKFQGEITIEHISRFEAESVSLSKPLPVTPVKNTIIHLATPSCSNGLENKTKTPYCLIKKAIKRMSDKDDNVNVGRGISILLEMTDSYSNQIDKELLLATNVDKLVESFSSVSVHKKSVERLMRRFARINQSVNTETKIPSGSKVIPKKSQSNRRSQKFAYQMAKDVAEPVKKYEKFPEFRKRNSPEENTVVPLDSRPVFASISPSTPSNANVMIPVDKENFAHIRPSLPVAGPIQKKKSTPRPTLMNKALRMANQSSKCYVKSK